MAFKTAPLPSPFLKKPITKKETFNSTGKGVFSDMNFALSSMQGWRVTQEDAHCHLFPSPRNQNLAFVGVFDGHAGELAAKFTADSVLRFIENSDTYKFLNHQQLDPIILARATMEGFFDCDRTLKLQPAFVKGDVSGCTGVVACLTPHNIIIGNTGDSRCVLVRGGKVAFATRDHKPTDQLEKDRVHAAGGGIKYGRINGDLASARSFGDFRYKQNPKLPDSQQIVTVMPDMSVLDRDPNDEILILACDGIWDVMSNLECASFVLAALRMGISLQETANLVLDECLKKSSGDNMSILIVTLDNAPKVAAVNQRFRTEDVRAQMLREVL